MAEMVRSAQVAAEFEQESQRIEALIWHATAITAGESVLLCGLSSDDTIARRIIEFGARLTVIETRNEALKRAEALGAKIIRGSTSVIPARDQSFDCALAHYYLHEVDPFFHQQVVSELARVGKRLVIVELAPPADALGRRIAALYARAKRELGLFEYYQLIDYWKKLISMAKADVSQAAFAFSKLPPAEFLEDTIELLLDTMEVEQVPEEYLDELRAIAEDTDAKLLPQARYVLVGAASGELPKRSAGVFPDVLTGIARASAAAAALPRPAAPAGGWVSGELAVPASFAEGLAEAAAEASAPGAPPPPQPEPAQAAAPPPAPQPPPKAAPPPQPAAPKPFAPVHQDDGIPAPPSLSGFEAEPPPGFTSVIREQFKPVKEPPGFGVPQIPPVQAPPGSGWSWEPPEDDDLTEDS